MKKWIIIYWSIIGVITVAFYMPTLVVIFGNNNLGEAEFGVNRLLLSIGTLIFLFAIMTFIIINGILTLKRSVHNIKKCDDEIFNEIDKYKRRWGERKGNYSMHIQKINFVYSKDGEVEKLVQNKELDRLYKRADFLSVQNNLYDVLMTALSSLVISVLASFIFNTMDNQTMDTTNGLKICVVLLLIVLAFFVVTLLRYNEKGQLGSYGHYIDEYERKLLLEKIEEIERDMKISKNDEAILETKHIIINALIDKISKEKSKKNKKQLEADIEKVEQLNLYVEDYNKYVKKEISVNDKMCYLLYEKQEEKDENQTSDLELANEAYKSLNEILEKYKLI